MNSNSENPEAPASPSAVPSVDEQHPPALEPVNVPAPLPPRYPPWTGWDVLALSLVAFVSVVGLQFVVTAMLPGDTFQAKVNRFLAMPELGLALQAIVELALLCCMYLVVASRTGGALFWKTMHWNRPDGIALYVLIGFVMQAVFLVAERFLPFPRNTPFEAVLQRPYSLVAVAVFSVTLGPLIEELYFRGFLYSLLKRYLGVFVAVTATAVPFGLLHAAQYGYSWASVLLVTIVGIVLAIVRERSNSLAASFLVHVAYNSVIVALMFIVTDGFRHAEKLGGR